MVDLKGIKNRKGVNELHSMFCWAVIKNWIYVKSHITFHQWQMMVREVVELTQTNMNGKEILVIDKLMKPLLQ